MAQYLSSNPVEQNVQGVRDLIENPINKTSVSDVVRSETAADTRENVLDLKLDDAELLSLKTKWEGKYMPYASKIRGRQDENYKYYMGQQREGTSIASDGRPISSNMIFTAVETFLPAALSKNPEPVVWSDNTDMGNEIANDVKTMLQFHASTLSLRNQLQLMTRKWMMDFLGVLKYGWDKKTGDITIDVRDAKDFIFDPDGYVDVWGHFCGYLGERRTQSADDLIKLFPKHREYISLKVDGKLGTPITWTEWWTDDYTFSTFEGVVLKKSKNPNFNYNTKKETTDEESGEIVSEDVLGNNHFAFPEKPYIFLSVFNFGKHPHDATGLIEQNIPNQRRISRRTEQIDYNLENANNSVAFSQSNFTNESAKAAARAKRKGHPILIPQGGPANQAIIPLVANGVSGDFFDELENSKNDLMQVFGTQGVTALPPKSDQTARGMILNHQYDNTRIGGGIGESLERVAKGVFNSFVQMYYVYYDDAHWASVLGQLKAVEFVVINSQKLAHARLVISVSPDSMKPHDEITEMNQALELWQAGALDIKSLLTILKFPDPQKTAAQAWLFKTNPQMYGMLNFPELTQEIQMLMMKTQQPVAPGTPPQPGNPGGAPEVPPRTPPTMGGVPVNPNLSTVKLPQ